MARSVVLRLLTAAPRSRHQLESALHKRGVDETVAARVLDRFTEVGLVDDAEYAQMLVRSQRESRGLGRRALAMELRRRGVSGPEASEALETVDEAAEEETARRVLERRWRSTSGLPVDVRMRRALGMLARKGYSGAMASRLVREMAERESAGSVAGQGLDPWDDPGAQDGVD